MIRIGELDWVVSYRECCGYFKASQVKIASSTYCFFPKQFTVGVLNATLDLAALVLVGVVGFLGSEVVLSPVVSLHVGGGCWLVWSASWALKWSCLPLSPVVSLGL